MATHVLIIPGWRPALLNELVGWHWTRVHRRKKADRDAIRAAALEQGVPRATGKRRVSLWVYLGFRQRTFDKDAPWKSLLDGLVQAQLLVDDNSRYVLQGTVEFHRDRDEPRCEIVLEDLE